jgi:putative methionine-R-sulfoxide reductase with GAF domain
MAATLNEEKPWKTDLARQSVQRRDQVARDVEEAIRVAPSFEAALTQTVEILKKRFARFSAVTAYVADGEDLVVHSALDRPTGPERVGSGGGPLAEAAQRHTTTIVADIANSPTWGGVGLASGSAAVTPIRTEAGLWAILEIWSDFRDAFGVHDGRFLDRIGTALARKTPAA